MKNLNLLTLLFSLFFFTGLQAQLSEKETTMSLGNQNSMIVELENANAKTAESVWKEFIKEYGKVKKNKKANEFYIEQTNIPSISGNSPCDVYVKFEERAGMVNAYFWVDMGDSFLNSETHKDGFQGAKTLLTEYGYAVQKKIISKELEEEQKKLKSFKKDLNKMVKDHKSYHKEIAEATEKIRKAEINIEKNEVSQINKNEEILAQTTIVKEIEERLNNVGKKVVVKEEPKTEKMEENEGEKKKGDGGK